MSNYASASHSIVFNGEDVTAGYLGATLSKAGDLQQMDIDLQGNASLTQLADQSGTFTVTYRQGCESLKLIDKWASGIQLVGENFALPFQGLITHDDPINGNTFVGYNAAIVNTGDRAWADVIGERTVTWRVAKVIETDNVVDVLANLQSFLR
ncbi:hypothetical protein NVP1121O_051 [Vibrio phage 1.121.O._10N.286.46.C4]|nr:hypothetical protein NVP1121O_051 [Vibrio phage 1.121.O._10N.286.46.C4]